jgi:rhamnosyltransferase
MRSHNDMPLIADTLAMLCRQRHPFDLVVFDNASTDGTAEEIRRYTDRIVHVPAGAYVPGRVLNRGMACAESPYVVFLNADCTPQHEDWLERLLAGFADDRTAAVFGRQMPRPDCHPLYARDTEETFGDGSRQRYWRHCFSMAASAIRKSVWDAMPFDERLQYSEDIDWTWRARRQGYRILYAPDAVALHSHNYTLRQLYRRQYGEGRAEAFIFDWPSWQRSLLRYTILPYGRQVLNDWRYCLKRGAFGAAAYAPLLRLAHMTGRRRGFMDGWRTRRQQESISCPRST